RHRRLDDSRSRLRRRERAVRAAPGGDRGARRRRRHRAMADTSAGACAGGHLAGWRFPRRQPLQPAISGLFGVGIAAFLAYRSGEARAFYLPGLIYSAACGLAFRVSVFARWPLAGVIWHGINGDGQGWRRDPRLLRAYTWATLLWALVFAARVVVQGLLYRYEEETWLGIARLAMGYPLVGIALLG